MSKTFDFPCGCSVPIDETVESFHGHPSLIYEVSQMPLDCPAVWDLISSGRTKGVFQLESSLGKTWAKRLKPRSIQHLSALISLLRPGCLASRDERGVSMTELYCRRKNGEEPVEVDIEAVRHILEPTYNIVVFQESFMQIAQLVAGFNLVEVDKLRKAAGKKNQELMTEVGVMFVDKADKLGVITREQAERLFANIKKSARYAFNACTSFDTKILRPGASKYASAAPFTVDEMYRIRNDLAYAKATGHDILRRKWMMIGNYGKSLSICEDGRIRPNVIVDIQPAGVRPVYKLTLENGAAIRITGNHKFPTSAGEMTVDQMMVADQWREIALYVKGAYEQGNGRKYNWSDLTNDDRIRKTGRSGFNTAGEENRWYTNGSWSKFKEFCNTTPNVCHDCGGRPLRIEVHHIDGDRTNSEFDNLVKLCASCHKKREYAVGRVRNGEKGYPTVMVPIHSILPDGECLTYDVTMAAPNHTFAVESGIMTCNSHSVSYAVNGYWSAHEKAHFPTYFFTSYLWFAKDKQEPIKEIRALIHEAKLFNIEVQPPRFSELESHFSTNGVEITFGLADVKSIGTKKVDKMRAAINAVEEVVGKPRLVWSWFDFLVYFANHVDSVLVKKMIEVGALRDYGLDRKKLLAEYQQWKRLSEGEQKQIANLKNDIVKWVPEGKLEKFLEVNPESEVDYDHYREGDGTLPVTLSRGRGVHSLEEAVETLLARTAGNTLGNATTPSHPKHVVTNARRGKVESILETLRNPHSLTSDRPYWIAKVEEEALGVALTYSNTEVADNTIVDTTCREFREGKAAETMVLGVEVQECRDMLVKNGENRGKSMAYLSVCDKTGGLDDVVLFSKAWEEYGNLVARENTVVALQGRRDKNRGSFVVDKVWSI